MSIPATAESWRLPRFRNRRRLERLQRCRAVAVDWHDLRETGVAEDIVDMVLHCTEDQCAGRFACSPGRHLKHSQQAKTDLAHEVEKNDDQANEVYLVTHICPS